MVRQVGPCVFDENGLLKKGVIIRHLVLPGQAEGAKQVMDWVAREFPKGTVLFSLMSQYTPYGRADQFPEIDRKLRRGEIRARAGLYGRPGLDGFTQSAPAQEGVYPALRLERLINAQFSFVFLRCFGVCHSEPVRTPAWESVFPGIGERDWPHQ